MSHKSALKRHATRWNQTCDSYAALNCTARSSVRTLSGLSLSLELELEVIFDVRIIMMLTSVRVRVGLATKSGGVTSNLNFRLLKIITMQCQ